MNRFAALKIMHVFIFGASNAMAIQCWGVALAMCCTCAHSCETVPRQYQFTHYVTLTSQASALKWQMLALGELQLVLGISLHPLWNGPSRKCASCRVTAVTALCNCREDRKLALKCVCVCVWVCVRMCCCLQGSAQTRMIRMISLNCLIFKFDGTHPAQAEGLGSPKKY